MLNLSRYTSRARNIIATAELEAKKLHASEAKSIHVLLAASIDKTGVAGRMLEKMGLPYELLLQEAERLHPAKDDISTEPKTSSEAKALYKLATQIAKDMGLAYVGTEHILLALVSQSDSDAAKLLTNKGYPKERVQQMLHQLLDTKAT